MSPEDDARTPEEQRVRDALRGLPPVAADPGFRLRLRREFRAGAIASTSRAWKIWALAASAILMLGGVSAIANRGEPWTVGATSGVGVVHIDGQAIDVTDPHLAAALVPGAVVTTDAQAELELMSEGTIALVVTPETTLRLPAVPGRWFHRSVRASLERGELRGRTGDRFAGARLQVDVPDATVEISGTTFAVLRNAEGSCVCVLEGTVSMQNRDGTFAVAPTRRRVVPPGGGASRDEPLRPMEAMKLEMLRDRTREIWAVESD